MQHFRVSLLSQGIRKTPPIEAGAFGLSGAEGRGRYSIKNTERSEQYKLQSSVFHSQGSRTLGKKGRAEGRISIWKKSFRRFEPPYCSVSSWLDRLSHSQSKYSKATRIGHTPRIGNRYYMITGSREFAQTSEVMDSYSREKSPGR